MNPEEQEAFRSMAKVGLTIFRGLMEDGATVEEAMWVLAAMFAGMMQSAQSRNVKEM